MLSTHSTCHANTCRKPAQAFDRRVALKAAALLALSGSVSRIAAPSPAIAAEPVRAATWSDGVDDPIARDDTGATFVADFPFGAIAPHWAGESGDGIVILMQFSVDGEVWTDPVFVGPAHADGGRADREGRRFGALTFTQDARYVFFQVLDERGLITSVDGLVFTYLDASTGPSLADVIALTAQGIGGAAPPIISRTAWGADESYRFDDDGNPWWPQDYQTVEHVIVHHTETPNMADPVTAVRAIYYYHAVERGWGDIGYNYLVDHLGNIYEGRAGGENVVGGHAYQFAYGSSGIGLIGNFSAEQETAEAQAALIAVTTWVARGLDVYGGRPFHEAGWVPTICGHRDVTDSACPGNALYDDLPRIRELVAEVQRIAGTGPVDSIAPGQVVRTVVEDGNLRAGPGLDRELLRTLPYDTVLTILDGPEVSDGLTWFDVADEEGTGWCASSLFEVAPASPHSEGAVLQSGDTVVVETDALNLRATASINAAVVATLQNGATGVVADGPAIAGGERWYELESPQGRGWAVAKYLTRISPTGDGPYTAGDRVEVATDFLNVRGRAGRGAWVVATLASGDTGTVRSGPSYLDGFSWYEIETPAGNGWVVADYLTRSTEPDPAVPALWVGDVVRVATDALHVRARPSSSASIVSTLVTGDHITITESPERAGGRTWYGVQTGDGDTGWCAGEYVERVPFERGQRVRVVDGSLNLRSAPDENSAINAVLPNGARLRIRSGPTVENGVDWYRVSSVDFGKGWCAGRFLTPL